MDGARAALTNAASNHGGLVLTQVPPLTNGIPDFREFYSKWNYLHPAPYTQGGFAHLLLPFNYEGQEGVGGKEMAYAFSFLLSNALDWAPDCYCARHAYFVFKRDPEAMQSAGKSLQKRLVRTAAKDWHVTHVVGGTLIRHGDDAFGARVVVFDRDGNKVFEHEYTTPKAYFDLVGDCACDILAFLGAKPNAALAAHLRKKRCEHFESIVDLGRAAFAEERTPEEFAIYDKILKRDPGFAEVRYWSSNQRNWADKNFHDYPDQEAIALDNYLMEAPLADFDPASCRNQVLAAHHDAWVDLAAKLVGEDATPVVDMRLVQIRNGAYKCLTHAMLQAANDAVCRNPCRFALHSSLEEAYRHHDIGVNDTAFGISISLTTVGIPSLANPHACENALLHTAYALGDLGHYTESVAILDRIALPSLDGEESGVAASMAGLYADALFNAGKFDKAAEIAYLTVEKQSDEWSRTRAWVYAGVAGRTDIAEHLQRTKPPTPNGVPFNDGGAGCYDQIISIRTGTFHWPPTSANHYASTIWMNESGVAAIITPAELDFARGTTFTRSTLHELFWRMPNNRVLWILLDAYDRQHPSEDMPAVYEMLAWLHNDDPWVRQAVQVAELRHPNAVISVETAEKTLAAIRLYPWPIVPADIRDVQAAPNFFALTPPELVTCAVKRMVEKKEYAAASQLCLRAIAVATAIKQPGLQNHFNYLYHLCSR
jgi:tetratricopeptide (TPR) repeat protein